MARLTLDQLLQARIAGPQILDPLAQQLGIPSWRVDGGGGSNEGGSPLVFDVADPTKLQALQGYGFDWQNTGPENTGTLTAYDPTGARVGSYSQQDSSLGADLASWAALAAAGFGGAGFLGLGPLGGTLGGLGGAVDMGAGASTGGALGGGAAELAGAGAAGGAAGAGVITGGGGLVAPTLGAGAGIGAGLGTTAGAAAAGGGFWSSVLPYVAPVAGAALGGIVQSRAASKAASAQTAAAQAAAAAVQKALAPYQAAGASALPAQQDLLGLNGAAKQQAAIDAIQASPAFTSQQKLGENRILANASATGGLRGGNTQAALAQFSPALLSQLIDQQYSRLGGLSTMGANAAAGVGTAQANAQTQIGSAQAGQALANGSALTNIISGGFGALGQYLGQQQPIFRQGGGF